jgi:hypothetical protein
VRVNKGTEELPLSQLFAEALGHGAESFVYFTLSAFARVVTEVLLHVGDGGLWKLLTGLEKLKHISVSLWGAF